MAIFQFFYGKISASIRPALPGRALLVGVGPEVWKKIFALAA